MNSMKRDLLVYLHTILRFSKRDIEYRQLSVAVSRCGGLDSFKMPKRDYAENSVFGTVN